MWRLALIEAEKPVTENLFGEKEKWTNKENGQRQEADSLLHNATRHTQHLHQIQNPGCSYSWEIFDTNFPMYYAEVRDGKKKTGKRRRKCISASWFSFPHYTWPLSRCIQNLKTLALIEAEKSVTEIFIGEKEKWTNKENDKQEEADSLLHNTTSYTQHLYKILKT